MKKLTKKDVVYGIVCIVLVAAVATFSALWAFAARKVKDGDSYYRQKCTAFSLENKHLSKGQIVFIGDSITDYYPLDAAYSELSLAAYNRGIGGDKTRGVLARLEVSLFALEPSVISLLIGINDVNSGVSNETLLANYEEILDKIQARLPAAKVFCVSLLPMNAKAAEMKLDYQAATERIPVLNAAIRSLAEARGYEFLNLYPLLKDENDHLIEAYSVDGLHLSAAGYEIWTSAFKPLLS